MKTKTLLSILILIVSFSLLSCYENKKVAVLPFDKEPSVPEAIGNSARRIVNDDMVRRRKFDAISMSLIDEEITKRGMTTMSSQIAAGRFLGADIIITGTIEAIITTQKRESAFNKLVDNTRGAVTSYKVSVTCTDVRKETVIASFTETYNVELKKMNKKVKKLKLGGRKSKWAD